MKGALPQIGYSLHFWQYAANPSRFIECGDNAGNKIFSAVWIELVNKTGNSFLFET